METIVVCRNCGARNRVKTQKQGKKPVCGKCGTPLPRGVSAPTRVIEVNDRTFDNEVLSFRGTVLVECWAPWCGACRQIAPVLNGIVREQGGRVKVVKINMDQNPRIAARYQVLSLPTFLFFKNGRLANTVTGAIPKSEIERNLYALR